MQIRYRHGKSSDLARGLPLLEPDRALFSPASWQCLPALLGDLIERERVRLCVVEDLDRDRMLCLGGSGFVHPKFLETNLNCPRGLVDAVFQAELTGRPAFLNRKQIAEANRGDDLRVLTFFGVPNGLDLDRPETLDALGPITDGWNFFHKGFSLRECWQEASIPMMMEMARRIGMRLIHERRLPSGEIAKLFRLTREEAMESTPSWPGSAMISPRPRFGFTRGEQQLLEIALLDLSDRDAARELELSTEAIKKRWRSIYNKVSRIDANLYRGELNGADQRRGLLQNLRNNLQEIRPY